MCVTNGSWIQKNWRPVTALTMLVLIVCHYAGILAYPIADQAWTLLQIAFGTYMGGRTLEKIAPTIADALKK